jgi:hypothetical protein
MLLLVRHAHAGDKSRWQGPDSLRPLSPAGQAEAAGLVVRLEEARMMLTHEHDRRILGGLHPAR